MTGFLIWIGVVGLLVAACVLGLVLLQRRARLQIGTAHVRSPAAAHAPPGADTYDIQAGLHPERGR